MWIQNDFNPISNRFQSDVEAIVKRIKNDVIAI